jgi:hypothetical protein
MSVGIHPNINRADSGFFMMTPLRTGDCTWTVDNSVAEPRLSDRFGRWRPRYSSAAVRFKEKCRVDPDDMPAPPRPRLARLRLRAICRRAAPGLQQFPGLGNLVQCGVGTSGLYISRLQERDKKEKNSVAGISW